MLQDGAGVDALRCRTSASFFCTAHVEDALLVHVCCQLRRVLHHGGGGL